VEWVIEWLGGQVDYTVLLEIGYGEGNYQWVVGFDVYRESVWVKSSSSWKPLKWGSKQNSRQENQQEHGRHGTKQEVNEYLLLALPA